MELVVEVTETERPTAETLSGLALPKVVPPQSGTEAGEPNGAGALGSHYARDYTCATRLIHGDNYGLFLHKVTKGCGQAPRRRYTRKRSEHGG